jgi:FKBP-type peptidyl-prolyl cis-trans isomerase
MKLNWMVSLGVLLLAFPVHAEETLVLKTPMEKVSYGIGVDVARNFMRLGIKFDTDILVRGLRDSLAGEKLLLTEDDLRATMSAYQRELIQKQTEAIKIAAAENKKISDAFLTENKAKKGVVTLPSGLQYQILTAGDGRKPNEAETVECNYRATLVNGTEIDSSYRTGQPGTFKVAGLITGWSEALKLMPVGSKWRLFVPPELAYGERGAGRDIGPNAMLIFELELIAIK